MVTLRSWRRDILSYGGRPKGPVRVGSTQQINKKCMKENGLMLVEIVEMEIGGQQKIQLVVGMVILGTGFD